ncbi:MAG: hypothetical protein AB1726_00345 [Planctomycetota bacterium]
MSVMPAVPALRLACRRSRDPRCDALAIDAFPRRSEAPSLVPRLPAPPSGRRLAAAVIATDQSTISHLKKSA